MAMKFSDVFGKPVDFWLNLHKEYNKREKLFKIWATRGPHTLVDYEIRSGIEAEIFGDNFSKDSIQTASYDFRVGGKAVITEEKGFKEVNVEKEQIILHPHESAILQSYEKVRFPLFLLGRLGAMTDLTLHGIDSLIGIHVDPGYEGYIDITLYNIGNSAFILDFKQPFVTMEICYLAIQPQKAYEGPNFHDKNFIESEIDAIKPKKEPSKNKNNYSKTQLEAAKSLLDLL